MDKGYVTLEEYLNYKQKLKDQIDQSEKKQTVLKQQINKIEQVPVEREVDGSTIWRLGIASFIAGAGAGLLFTKDSSFAAKAITSFVCAEAAAGTAILGSFAYALKPISNAINRERLAHKYKKLTKQQSLVVANENRLEQLEREEILNDLYL
jgi:hypothetical protein